VTKGLGRGRKDAKKKENGRDEERWSKGDLPLLSQDACRLPALFSPSQSLNPSVLIRRDAAQMEASLLSG
jgi:hypothetical protein